MRQHSHAVVCVIGDSQSQIYIVTYRPSWSRLHLTPSAQCELKIAPSHTKRASLTAWLVTVTIAIGVASGEVVTEHCSAANCLDYMGTSNVSFISQFSITVTIGNSHTYYAYFALHHCDDAGCDMLATCKSRDIT